jgi:hypothetical protein
MMYDPILHIFTVCLFCSYLIRKNSILRTHTLYNLSSTGVLYVILSFIHAVYRILFNGSFFFPKLTSLYPKCCALSLNLYLFL